MAKNIYIGIDPGAAGFICIHVVKEGYKFYEVPKIGKFVDVNALNKIFRGLIMTCELERLSVHACLEDVHAIYGSSAKGTFNFGYVVGLIEMAIVSNNIPFTRVQPKKWQSVIWAGIPLQKKLSSTGLTMVTDTKLMSKMAAKRLFPEMDFRRNERCKVDDENKIDALLICEYAERTF